MLEAENAALRAELETYRATPLPADYALTVDIDVIEDYATRAGLKHLERAAPGVLTTEISGDNIDFKLNIQLFEREDVLFLATSDYFRLDQATSPEATVLVLTQIATLNYELLLGKFQLNPTTGEVALSVELNVDDGLGFATFQTVLLHLMRTADRNHPALVRAARGEGL